MKLIALLAHIKIYKPVTITNIRNITLFEGVAKDAIPFFINEEKTLDYLNCEVTYFTETDHRVVIEVDHFPIKQFQIPVSEALMVIKEEWGEGVHNSFELYNASKIDFNELCEGLTILYSKIKFAFKCITAISKERLALETAIDNEYKSYIGKII